MTLSDPFCVGRYRDEFLHLMRSGTVDIVFANEAEALSLYETEDLEQALRSMETIAGSRSSPEARTGSIILGDDERVDIPAAPIRELVDSTGAGDLYAAGFLYGYTRQMAFETCGRLGSLAAAHIIQQVGPRPTRSLGEIARDSGLL